MSGLRSVQINKGSRPVEMKTQLEDATTDEERHRIANSDLFMIADIEDKEVFYHEAIWAKANKKLIPEGMLVYHKDGNTVNNDPDNLDLVEENKHHGDLHKEENKVFHEHLIDQNREFLRKYFQDVYQEIFGVI